MDVSGSYGCNCICSNSMAFKILIDLVKLQELAASALSRFLFALEG